MKLNIMKVSISSGITGLILFLLSSLLFMPMRFGLNNGYSMMRGFYYSNVYTAIFELFYSFLFGFIIGLVFSFVYNLIDREQNVKNKSRR